MTSTGWPPLPSGRQGWSKAQHGTQAGYQRHLYTGSIPCEPCRLAKRDYNRQAQRDYRARKASQ